MKIRFGTNQIVDTNLLGEQTVATMLESTEEADILNDSINDGTTSYEDQTQLNILKRFVKGFLATLGDGCGRADLNGKQPELVNHLYLEFDDILSSISDEQGWNDLADAIQYDEKVEEEGE